MRFCQEDRLRREVEWRMRLNVSSSGRPKIARRILMRTNQCEAVLIAPTEIALWARSLSIAVCNHFGSTEILAQMGKAFAEANWKLMSQPRWQIPQRRTWFRRCFHASMLYFKISVWLVKISVQKRIPRTLSGTLISANRTLISSWSG